MKSKFTQPPISVNPTLGFRAMFHGGTLSGCDTQSNKHVMVEIMTVELPPLNFRAALPCGSATQKIPRPVAGGLRNWVCDL
jgi:hypothetical protein